MRTLNATLAASCLALVALTGCSNKTEGDRTLEKAQTLEDAGERMKSGEQMIRDGDAMEAAGRRAKLQGDNAEGDRMIADGIAQRKAGQAKIDAARRMKAGT